MTTLYAEAVTAGYGARTVLHACTLSVGRGEVVAIVGPNGAGKSTLLRVLAGLLRPSSGSVRIDRVDVATLARPQLARRIAVVPQIFDTLFPFSVREVVALGRTARLGMFGGASRTDADAVERAIADLDLADLASRRIDRLSGGERQRAVLAMALAQEADVLLLDEPTVHLDPAHQVAMLRLVRELACARGFAVAAVLHDSGECEVGVHMHSTRDGAAAKVIAAYDAGCRRFDAAMGGLGGCPFAQDQLIGNVPTEEVLRVLKQRGLDLSIERQLPVIAAMNAAISDEFLADAAAAD